MRRWLKKQSVFKTSFRLQHPFFLVNCFMSFPGKNIENDLPSSQVNEPEADYEKAELDLLKEGMKRTHTERFQMMMKLIKVGRMLKNAKITHQKSK